MERRRLLAMAAAGAAFSAAPRPSLASELPTAGKPQRELPDFPRDDPAFNVLTVGKLQGDLSGAPTWIFNPGTVYGVLPGQGLPPAEFGRALFKVEGVTRRLSRRLPDGSVAEQSRNWMFFLDADTGAPLTQFRNPWTGATLDVPPWRGSPGRSTLTAQGPIVQFGAGFENTSIGKPLHLDWRSLGDTTWIGRQASTRLREPNGRVRNEMSIDAWVCRTRDVADTRLTHIPATNAWTSLGEWLPWLQMGSRSGNLLWRIESTVLHTAEALPAAFRERMQSVLPGKLEEPMEWQA